MAYHLTDEQIADAMHRYDAGEALESIAAVIGCRRATVNYHARKTGRPRRREQLHGTEKTYRKVGRSGYVYLVTRYYVDGQRRYRHRLEHRVVMEQHLGRPLRRGETVHHRNGVRHDNRVANLELRAGAHGSGATHCRHCGMPL
jgi:hypothetical protein